MNLDLVKERDYGNQIGVHQKSMKVRKKVIDVI